MRPKPPVIKLTIAEMQQRFNAGKFQERMKNGEFPRIERKVGTPLPDKLRDFGDIVTVGTFCFDVDGTEVFYTHHFECPYGRPLYVEKPEKDGKPWAVYFIGAQIDPKRIYEGGIQYRLKKGQK